MIVSFIFLRLSSLCFDSVIYILSNSTVYSNTALSFLNSFSLEFSCFPSIQWKIIVKQHPFPQRLLLYTNKISCNLFYLPVSWAHWFHLAFTTHKLSMCASAQLRDLLNRCTFIFHLSWLLFFGFKFRYGLSLLCLFFALSKNYSNKLLKKKPNNPPNNLTDKHADALIIRLLPSLKIFSYRLSSPGNIQQARY